MPTYRVCRTEHITECRLLDIEADSPRHAAELAVADYDQFEVDDPTVEHTAPDEFTVFDEAGMKELGEWYETYDDEGNVSLSSDEPGLTFTPITDETQKKLEHDLTGG